MTTTNLSIAKQVYSQYLTAKQNKTVKTFVKLTRNSYGVDFSSRGIMDNGYSFASVYNNEQVFCEYFNKFNTITAEPTNEPTEPMTQPIEPVTVTAAEPVQAEPVTKQNKTNSNEAEQLAGLIAKLAGNSINEGRVIELIKQHGSTVEVTKYISKYNGVETTTKLGAKHESFDDLLALISCGINAWITGPAGSGKTHSVKQVAEVLNLPFYAKSVCGQTPSFDFLGYNDANGQFIETDFYNAYTGGGVFCLDEIDNGNANVLAVLNSALSNGVCSFACGMVEKHPDFICVATANTIGNGGNKKYSGRLVIDKATLDRFGFIHWGYDRNIELSMIGGNLEVFNAVQDIRKKAEQANLDCIISPRATVNVYKLVSTGMDLKKALDFAIFNKLTDNEKQVIKG